MVLAVALAGRRCSRRRRVGRRTAPRTTTGRTACRRRPSPAAWSWRRSTRCACWSGRASPTASRSRASRPPPTRTSRIPRWRRSIARRLYSRRDGRLIGEALVLTLDGAELFDESVLDAFVEAAVGAQGDGTATTATVGGRPVLRSSGPSGTVMGYREGNQLMLVRGADDARRPRGRGAPAAGARGRGGRRGGAVHAAGPAADRRGVRAGADGDVPADPAARGGAAARAARRCRAPPRCRVATAWWRASGARPCGRTRSTPAPTRAPSRVEPAVAALVSARAGRRAGRGHRGRSAASSCRRRPRGQPLGPCLPPPGPGRSWSRAPTPPSSTPSSPPGSPRWAEIPGSASVTAERC